MSRLGVLGYLTHGVGTPLVGRKQLVDCLGVVGRDGVLLSEVALLNDRVGELQAVSVAQLYQRARRGSESDRP